MMSCNSTVICPVLVLHHSPSGILKCAEFQKGTIYDIIDDKTEVIQSDKFNRLGKQIY